MPREMPRIGDVRGKYAYILNSINEIPLNSQIC
jgi:hypothetical protein